MTTILHLYNELSTGGAGRAGLSTAKYSARQGNFRHIMAQIKPDSINPDFMELAREHQIEVVPPGSHQELCHYLEMADIVQLNWWNSPVMYEFFQKELPPMRLIGWFHVGGHVAPQIITDSVINYFDLAVACSPHTFESPSFRKLTAQTNGEKTAMAYGPADFERLAGFSPKAHTGFNVGYIGTVHYIKMHPDYVKMSAAIDIPDIRFVVCGAGGHEGDIKARAAALGRSDRFQVMGYVKDVKSVIETLDVYGYPLCEGTYAASEVNLQEVMFAGIPPVVFPNGGVRLLVKHNETGLMVNSAREYKEAIEFLYRNPEERKRLGNNAHQYAKTTFGAENAAKVFNPLYTKILKQEKRNRSWKHSGQGALSGAKLFIESLGNASKPFVVSMTSGDEAEIFAVEQQIAQSSEVMLSSGISSYMNHFPKDPYLQLWQGLSHGYHNRVAEFAACMVASIQCGIPHWRPQWYLAKLMRELGDIESARAFLGLVLTDAPHFQPARELLNHISVS